MIPTETYFLWTEGILQKSHATPSKIYFLWAEGMSEKYSILKSKILTTTLEYTCLVTSKKTHFMWTKGISEKKPSNTRFSINNHYQYTHGMWPPEKHILYVPKHFKIKDLDINSHYWYTHGMWLPEKHILFAPKEYQKNILKWKS